MVFYQKNAKFSKICEEHGIKFTPSQSKIINSMGFGKCSSSYEGFNLTVTGNFTVNEAKDLAKEIMSSD